MKTRIKKGDVITTVNCKHPYVIEEIEDAELTGVSLAKFEEEDIETSVFKRAWTWLRNAPQELILRVIGR